jgi:dTDP-4-amino-4,6-dideoxygalactose transaminase
MAGGDARDGLIDHLRGEGIQAAFHYLPLHLSPMGRGLGGREGDCPVTESLSARLVRLPLFTAITDDEVEAVVQAVQAFRPA